MKILQVNTYDINGGAARAAHRLFKGLRAIGSDCRMVVLQKKCDDPDILPLGQLSPAEAQRAQAIQSEMLEEKAHYQALNAPGFVGFHSDRSPVGEVLVDRLPAADIVNLHWVRSLIDYKVFFSTRPATQPVVWTLHDMHAFTGGCHYAGGCERFADTCGSCPFLRSDDPEDLSFRILRRKIEALSVRLNRLQIVTPSRWLAGEAQRSALFRDVPVDVIPPGIETDVFVPHDRQEIRRAYNLPPDMKLILFVAHVLSDPRKGLAYLDEALCRLGPRPDVGLLMVGGGTPVLQAPIRLLRTGMVSNDEVVSRLYSAADVVVVPSLEDNLPNTILEAMASGTPVIGFDIGGVPDLVIPGETGFLAAPANGSALAEALSRALADMERLSAMGHVARARIEREHTLEVSAGHYRSLYQRLLSSGT